MKLAVGVGKSAPELLLLPEVVEFDEETEDFLAEFSLDLAKK